VKSNDLEYYATVMDEKGPAMTWYDCAAAVTVLQLAVQQLTVQQLWLCSSCDCAAAVTVQQLTVRQ
jgi:hypothetical protein